MNHELIIDTDPDDGHSVGTCPCGGFKFEGPEDMVRSFYGAHLRYPDTTLRGVGSR